MFKWTRLSSAPLASEMYTWGCPCFVLDSHLQGSSIVLRWDERFQIGSYMGRSPQHFGNDPLSSTLVPGASVPGFTSSLMITLKRLTHYEKVKFPNDGSG